MINFGQQPVIIVGMHRSGTSLATRILEKLGLFVGNDLESNHESTFFLDLNEWLLNQAGASWDNPHAFEYLANSHRDWELALDYAEYLLSSPRKLQYLGLRRSAELLFTGEDIKSWGWKDPRNTITLPFWLELFPNAKVLCIERHGVDVARSLRDRRRRKAKAHRGRYESLRNALSPIYWARMKESGFGGSVRTATLTGAFSLWTEYVQSAHTHLRQYGNSMTVRYEDLLQSPMDTVEDLAEFCDLSRTSFDKDEIVEKVDASRAFAYRDSPTLKKFASSVSDTLAEYGYSA